jgi:AAA15 family ATPase/GTPase
MLIRFSVGNFRSFKDCQSLYLNAVKTCKEWQDNNTAEDCGMRAVRTVVIYGANASGKTNLLIAMLRMKTFMLSSVDIDKNPNFLLAEPFLLCSGNLNKPETFELEFTAAGRHFVYGFSLALKDALPSNYEIVKEWLIEVVKGRQIPCFMRECRMDSAARRVDVIDVNEKSMPQGRGLERRTRPDSLFFTVAAQFAEPTCQMISEYIRASLNVISGVNRQGMAEYSKSKLVLDAEMAGRIKKLISDADTGVKDLLMGDNGQVISNHNLYDVDGSVVGKYSFMFNFAESQGTQKLFDLAGMLIDALNNGRILVVDELDAQLHPILVRHLVELFNNPATNPKNAQLIFNAQSPDLLGYKVHSEEKGKKITRLRRDQIYFVEKDNQESSKVFSLIEFKKDSGLRTRNDASYDKDYLAGVYGGIPFPKEMVAEAAGNG